MFTVVFDFAEESVRAFDFVERGSERHEGYVANSSIVAVEWRRTRRHRRRRDQHGSIVLGHSNENT